MTQAGIGDLKDLARRYQVRFAVAPDRIGIRGRVVEIRFQLELRGMHDGCSGDSDIPCRGCTRVLTALFDVADALIPIEQEVGKRLGRNYRKAMHYERRGNLRGVALVVEFKMRRRFGQPIDGWAMALLHQQLVRFLLDCGCCQTESPSRAGAEETCAVRSFQDERQADLAAAPVG